MAPDPSVPELRASDADREAAGERLRTAASEGRLDPLELDQRLSAVYAARYCSELTRLTADVTPPPPAPAGPPVFVKRQPGTNGLAIASLVCGLVWIWWFGSVLAIVFGHVALGQIRRSGGAQAGRGLAIAGLTLGYIGALGFIGIILSAILG